jgi:hypothetical protein
MEITAWQRSWWGMEEKRESLSPVEEVKESSEAANGGGPLFHSQVGEVGGCAKNR